MQVRRDAGQHADQARGHEPAAKDDVLLQRGRPRQRLQANRAALDDGSRADDPVALRPAGAVYDE